MTVSFNEAIDPESFTPDDVTFQYVPGSTTPWSISGPISIADVRPVTHSDGTIDHRTFEILFPTIHVQEGSLIGVGQYRMTIGPDIRDQNGYRLDLNRDGTDGHPAGDRYEVSFSIGYHYPGSFLNDLKHEAANWINRNILEPPASTPPVIRGTDVVTGGGVLDHLGGNPTDSMGSVLSGRLGTSAVAVNLAPQQNAVSGTAAFSTAAISSAASSSVAATRSARQPVTEISSGDIRLDGSTVRIDGTGHRDVTSVDTMADGAVVVSLTSYDEQDRVVSDRRAVYEQHRVTDLVFEGLAGDDWFLNRTNRASRGDGGSGNDLLIGGSGRDVLRGGRGNDFLAGNEGNDRLYGGRGNDRLEGRHGHDWFYGQSGRDHLDGGRHNDRLYGGSGRDRLYGGRNNDRIYGGRGNDRLYGQHGHDRLYGQSGRDRLDGGRHNDRLYGGDGRDRLYGRSGNDRLDGGHDGDRDRLNGGSGIDGFIQHLERRIRRWFWSWRSYWSAEDAISDAPDRVYNRRH